MSKRLLVIYGCHGAGKTTLAKNILMSDGEKLTELATDFGKITLSKNKKFIAVGKYSTNCGGCDSLKTVEDYFKQVEYIIKNYPDANIIMEGILLSELWQNPLKKFLRIKYDFGFTIDMVLLYTKAATSFSRVLRRNNSKPNIKNIIGKQRAVVRTFDKFQKVKEFNTMIIDTENKTSDDVFGYFISNSKFIRGK